MTTSTTSTTLGHRPIRSRLLLVLAISGMCASGITAVQAAPQAALPASQRPNNATVSPLSGDVIDAVRAWASDPAACDGAAFGPECHVEADFLPLSHYVEGHARLTITSARAVVAYTAWKAATDDRAYSAPADLRDVVTVHCGGHDTGAIFECASVQVMSASGTAVAPVTYDAGASVSRNASGVKWSVRDVTADFPIVRLRDGLIVTYTDFSGGTWQFTVTAAQAREPLLLSIENGSVKR